MKTIQVSDKQWAEIKESYADPDFIYCVGCRNNNHTIGKPGDVKTVHVKTGEKPYWEDCLLVTYPDNRTEGVAHVECEGLVRGHHPDAQIQRICGEIG